MVITISSLRARGSDYDQSSVRVQTTITIPAYQAAPPADQGHTIKPKSSFLFVLLDKCMLCQDVHRLDVCKFYKFVLRAYQLNEKLV